MIDLPTGDPMDLRPAYQFTQTIYRNNATGEIATSATDPDVSYTQLGIAGQSIPFASALAHGLINADGSSKAPAKVKAVKGPPANKMMPGPDETKQSDQTKADLK